MRNQHPLTTTNALIETIESLAAEVLLFNVSLLLIVKNVQAFYFLQ